MRTYRSPYVVGRGASLISEPAQQLAAEFQKVADHTHKLLSDVFTDLALFYEQTYNIRALRPGPVFVCERFECQQPDFHEAIPYTPCWYYYVDEYGDSLVQEYMYEREYDPESPFKDVTDDSLFEQVADIIHDDEDISKVRENDIGWFWQWGNWYNNPFEIHELPVRQLVEQLQRIKRGRRPQTHEVFADGNKVPYVAPPRKLREQSAELLETMQRHDQIRNIVNRKLSNWCEIPPLINTEQWSTADATYDRKNPLHNKPRQPFDAYPQGYYENSNWDFVADHEILGFLQCNTTPQIWAKFRQWYSERYNLARHMFDAANELFKLAKGNADWFIKQRPQLARYYQTDQYWKSPLGQAFVEFSKNERPHNRPLIAEPVCEIYIPTN